MEHSEMVKNLHQSLRIKVKQGQSPDDVWTDLLKDKKVLNKYSHSMNALATKEWDKKDRENRIIWSMETCLDYFERGGLQKLVRKTHKSKLFQALRNCGIDENDEERQKISDTISNMDILYENIFKDRYLLLDVGSCFNPLKNNAKFSTIAIDISPAVEDVLYCDFLSVEHEPPKKKFESPTDNDVERDVKSCLKETISEGKLYENFFDIVLFSLLLSYFPSPAQRLKCCINAHKSLKLYGLLVIITPDSSHQNRHQPMMKSWKEALEGIGFTRYRYEKLEHLHCMAYQKSSNEQSEGCFSNHIYIPQDFQTLDDRAQIHETSKKSSIESD